MQKGWRGSAKTVGESRQKRLRRLAEGAYRKPERQRSAIRRIANLVRKREQPVDFYFNLRGGIYRSETGDPRVLAWETARGVGNARYQNSSRGNVESFSSGPKRFLHICNGSSNLCAFTEARPSPPIPASPPSSLFPIEFARTARQTPPFRRSRSAIYFPRVGAQTGCIKRPTEFEKESETQRTPYPIVRN